MVADVIIEPYIVLGWMGKLKWYHFKGTEGSPVSIGYNGNSYDFVHNESLYYFYEYDPNSGREILKIPVDSYVSDYNNIIMAESVDLIDFFTITHNIQYYLPNKYTVYCSIKIKFGLNQRAHG